MLVGWWLAGCLLLTVMYRSLLISHLVVQGKLPVINTMEELVGREDYTWATTRVEDNIFMRILSSSPDPTKQKIHKGMQKECLEAGLQRVLNDDFAYFKIYYYLRIVVATRFTDARGYTPIHISSEKTNFFSGNSFSFRPGAPFYQHFSLARQRLMEAGLIFFFMDNVINTHVRKARLEDKRKKNSEMNQSVTILEQERAEGQVVLKLKHLLGLFLMLVLGHGLGCLVFLVEVYPSR